MQSSTEDVKSILILSDESTSELQQISETMQREGFAVHISSAPSGHPDKDLIRDMDMIVLAYRSFLFESLSTISQLRTRFEGLIAMLGDPVEEMLQVVLYEHGVDVMLIKPINPLLLLARIRAIFRLNGCRKPCSRLTFNGLEIDGGSRSASYNGDELPLSSREFDILWYMAQNSHDILDRDRLYKNVFGTVYNGYDRSIDMYISRLRNKLTEKTDLPPIIKTVRGRGYLFATDQL